MNYVYHSSTTTGLTVIEPRVSTHQQAWVYAMEKPEFCVMFLGDYGDIVNQVHVIRGIPYIVERVQNALEYGFGKRKGSIYTLDGSSFKSGVTSFKAELVSDHACPVISEEKIENALDKVLELEAAGKIIIYRYPTLPNWLPSDKSDLIAKAVDWAPKFGMDVLDAFERFHPEIMDSIRQKLNNDTN